MRKAILIIIAAQAAFLTLMTLWPDPPGMDAAGRGMVMGFLMIFWAITALFLIPALILALNNKALNWALGLALTPPVLALIGIAG
ncbi:MAG: hypothetical protein QNJ16_04975 [Rhodobacter sp.]|nr:hypothetical protein [Rhodobacter sp.]